MTKKIFYVISFVTLAVLFFSSCEDDPTFPDPGFELGNKKVEIRRDTADYCDIKTRMNVPNGVQKIEILNALTYDLLEEVSGYNGKTKFDFIYRVDLIPFEKDTVLNYIIKVTDNDSRSFNQGVRIDMKGFSFPEIKLIGGTNLAVAAPAYVVKGLVSTGMNALKSVRINYEGEEKYMYSPSENDTVIYEMPLKELIFLGKMDLGNEYFIDIIIEDEAGQVSKTVLTLRKTNEIKRPDYIVYETRSGSTIKIDFHYDEERVIRIDYIFQNGTNYQSVFKYNELGLVDTLIYRNPNSLDLVDNENRYYFNYVSNTKELLNIEHQRIDFNSEGEIISDGTKSIKMSDFVYVNGVVSSFRRGGVLFLMFTILILLILEIRFLVNFGREIRM